jgi:Glu-tRNA(Gln) amidotransferase subunit E-like FAD-binding protein
MVSLDAIISSNQHIASKIPPDIVAVFVGRTSRIGETLMKQLVKYAVVRTQIYFVGQSLNAGRRLTTELEAINPGGIYHFI